MTDNEENLTQITDDELTDIEEVATVEKTKKPYKMTDARKKALEKGRETRAKKVAEKKAVKDEEKEISKLNKQRQKAMATLGITEESLNKSQRVKEENDFDKKVMLSVAKVVKKTKAKPKQKIVYETESETESESSDDEPPTVERKRRPAYTETQIREILNEPAPKPFRLKRV
jgi:hypothetical protein